MCPGPDDYPTGQVKDEDRNCIEGEVQCVGNTQSILTAIKEL